MPSSAFYEEVLDSISPPLFHLGSWCLIGGLTALGVLSIYAPATAAAMYGLPVAVETAWVKVAGLRDIGMAATALALYRNEPRGMRYFCPALLMIPLGDAALTYAFGGTLMGALTHLGGVFAVGALSFFAWKNGELNNDFSYAKKA